MTGQGIRIPKSQFLGGATAVQSSLRRRIATSPIAQAAAVPLSSALSDRAERSGRHYLFFKEQPLDHWWPGDGIGAAWAG